MWGKENNVHLHSCKTTRFIEFHPSNNRLWHVPRAYIHSLHTLKEEKRKIKQPTPSCMSVGHGPLYHLSHSI